GLLEPSIKVPLRTTRVLLMDTSRSRSIVQTLPPNRRASQPQYALADPSFSEGRRGRLSSGCCYDPCEVKPDGLTIAQREGKCAMAEKQYDRSTQDLGNIVNLGHVNVCISDQRLATQYYIIGLGLTRDPFLNTGAGNMWVNVGVSQF